MCYPINVFYFENKNKIFRKNGNMKQKLFKKQEARAHFCYCKTQRHLLIDLQKPCSTLILLFSRSRHLLLLLFMPLKTASNIFFFTNA